jgi:6-methylsalicylate decarboxylase
MGQLNLSRRRIVSALALTAGTLGSGVLTQGASRRSDSSIVDVHSHALLPVWLAAAAKAQGVSSGRVSIAGIPAPDWSVEGHLRMMDEHGIAASVLSWPRGAGFLRGQAARDLARAMNEEFASIVARHPTRFGAFAALPFDDMDAAIEETAYALDVLKLDGVTATTQVDGVYLGDSRYEAWFSALNQRSATLFVHPTTPKGFDCCDIGLNVSIIEYMFDVTRMIANMVVTGAKARFPQIKLICTHAGGTMPFIAARFGILEPLFGAGKDRAVLSAREIEATLATFHYDLTASTTAASLDGLRRLAPVSQFHMGFDYPMMPSETIAPALANFSVYRNFSREDRRKICRTNSLALLPRLRAILPA